MDKASCIDLGARLSVRSLISALLTALTSAECTLSASGVYIATLLEFLYCHFCLGSRVYPFLIFCFVYLSINHAWVSGLWRDIYLPTLVANSGAFLSLHLQKRRNKWSEIPFKFSLWIFFHDAMAMFDAIAMIKKKKDAFFMDRVREEERLQVPFFPGCWGNRTPKTFVLKGSIFICLHQHGFYRKISNILHAAFLQQNKVSFTAKYTYGNKAFVYLW